MKRAFLSSFLIVYIIGINQSFAQSKLDDYFDTLFNNQKFMGSVAISHNDSIIYSKSVGYADVQNSLKTNSDTKFRIGSLTKTFTAALVLKAVEESKLKLDDSLAVYYPQIKNANRITIRQLLEHRSGIFNFTEIENEQKWEQRYHTEKEFITTDRPNKVHEGRNVKRFREMMGIKQEGLAASLGEEWSQKKISVLESKEKIEDALLAEIAQILKVPEEAIRNFDEERAVNIIANTFQDDSVAYAENYKCTFNPLDKLMETVEEIKKLHAEKEALYERLLKAQENK